MKSIIMPKNPEEIITFLEQHNLVAEITNFETNSSSESELESAKFGLVGLPLCTNITLTMQCHDKDEE